MPINNSFEDKSEFEISNIIEGGTGPVPSGDIQFEYSNPSISVDTGSNFVAHDIIGGPTVRQRIGDKPLEISVDGVCTEETVKQIEQLRNAASATLISDRFSSESITVHVASLSTDPLEDGGAADLQSGEFLYTYSLNCVEILDTGD
jgi:hypothetical protein